MSAVFLGALFLISLGLNLVWEFAHVRLYTTKVSSLFLVLQSLKDALWITLAWWVMPHLAGFVLLLFIFSYGVEWHAIRTKRWEYANRMPLVLGVGLTPLLELAVTGLAAVQLATLLVL